MTPIQDIDRQPVIRFCEIGLSQLRMPIQLQALIGVRILHCEPVYHQLTLES